MLLTLKYSSPNLLILAEQLRINKVILVGNLGDNPTIRETNDKREVANFSLATSKKWKDKNTGEKKERTEWHQVSIFNEGLVSIVKQYLQKGSKVYLEGELQTRKWRDKEGIDRYKTSVVLQGFSATLVMLEGKEPEEQEFEL